MTNDYGQRQFQRQQFGHSPSEVQEAVDHESVREQLKKPARGLLITGLLSVLVAVGGLAGGIIYSAANKVSIQRHWTYQLFGEEIVIRPGRGTSKKIKEEKERRDGQARAAFAMVLGAISIGCLMMASLYMMFVSGGIMMAQLKNYRMCKLICILATIPVISPLLVAGIPFGLMGLAQLRKAKVKKAFLT